jgi:hypothetical protein
MSRAVESDLGPLPSPGEESPPTSLYEEEADARPMNGKARPLTIVSGGERETASPAPVRASAAEEAVVGALLIGARWSDVAPVIRVSDYHPKLRPILAAVEALARDNLPHDAVTVSRHLEAAGLLGAVGGLARLSELARNTPTAANVLAYARAVCRGVIEQRLPPDHRDADSIAQIRRTLDELDALDAPATPAIVLRHIADVVGERREAEWLGGLHKVLERYVQAVIAGARGVFKSIIADHWAMTAALTGEGVVILSAEGAGLGRRIEAWLKVHAPAVDPRKLPLFTLERAVNLNAPAVLEDLRAAIDTAGITPALIVVDTFSKYAPGLDENDNAEVAAFLSALSAGLRERYGATVLLVAHAGHATGNRPRGASVLMANPDAEYIVERPDPNGLTATVSRQRFKDSPTLPPLAYTAEVIDLGRTDRRGEPVTSLIVRDADASTFIAAARPALHGKAQKQLLGALRAQAKDGAGIWSLTDLREVGRKAGLHKNTARAAADALAASPFMVASVGGWKLADA